MSPFRSRPAQLQQNPQEHPRRTSAHITSTIESLPRPTPATRSCWKRAAPSSTSAIARYSLDSSENDRATLSPLVRRAQPRPPRPRRHTARRGRFGSPRSASASPGRRPSSSPRTSTSARPAHARHHPAALPAHLLDRVLGRAFPDDRSEGFRSSMDLERSFGPGYARGILTRGQHAWAVVAVNASTSPRPSSTASSPSASCGCSTAAITPPRPPPADVGRTSLRGCASLFRAAPPPPRCRASPGSTRASRSYEVFELDEHTEDLTPPRSPPTHGNLNTRLVHAPNLPLWRSGALRRCHPGEVLALLPPGTRGGRPRHPTNLAARQIKTCHARPQPQAKWRDPCISPPPNPLPQPILPTPPSQRLRAPPITAPTRDGWVAAANSCQGHPAHRNQTRIAQPQTCELRLRSFNRACLSQTTAWSSGRLRDAFAGQSLQPPTLTSRSSSVHRRNLFDRRRATGAHFRELVRHLE